ncbi:hypothetical protein JCM18899A_29190 [Nocardioides sp. AN3]
MTAPSSSAARPHIDGLEVRFAGADSGAYQLTPVLRETGDHLTFMRSLALDHAAGPSP